MVGDDRAVYTILSGFGEVTSNGVVTATAKGSLVVGVTFPTYFAASHLSDAILVTVVQYESLVLSILPYPDYTSTHTDAHILNRIHCSEDYQQAIVSATRGCFKW